MIIEVIKGQQVTLRPANIRDRRQIFEWLTQSDLTSRMLGPPLFPETTIPTWEYFIHDYNSSYFNDENPDKGRSFVIEVNEEPVGHLNYNQINRLTHTVEFDIWLRSSVFCGKGYGPDAINTLCRYLAANFNCQRFILAPSARNQAALGAYAKCGFKPTRELPNNFIPDYPDTIVMVKTLNTEEES